MIKKKTSYTPGHPVMGSDDMLRALKAMYAPESYGAELGLAWALAASLEVLELAADYPTAEEKLKEHMSIHDHCVRTGVPDDDNVEVVAPDCANDAPQERVAFFTWAREKHLSFWGHASAEDSSIIYCNEDGQVHIVYDAPNCAFRLFERGWAAAVRQVYAATSVSFILAP